MTKNPLNISDIDLYQIFREGVQKEKDDINQKGMWNLVSQSFLFSSYASMINNVDNVKPYPFDKIFQLLLNFIPFSGCLLAIVMMIAVMESVFYISKMRSRFEFKKTTNADELPLLGNKEERRLTASIVPFLVPLVFLSIWSLILMKWFDVL